MALSDDPHAPLQLADGTYINPYDGTVIKPEGERTKKKYVEVPSGSEAQKMVAKSRRAVADLPLPPGQMNVVALCVTYTMWGMTDEDIALATGSLSVQQVKNIKQLTAFETMMNDVMAGVLEHETTNVRNFFQQNAMDSARKIVDLATDADGALGFAAARDVLDRAGHRPADVVEHRVSMENALRIEVVRKADPIEVPVIETTWSEK